MAESKKRKECKVCGGKGWRDLTLPLGEGRCKCSECKGTGKIPAILCPTCEGECYVWKFWLPGMAEQIRCPTCHANGYI